MSRFMRGSFTAGAALSAIFTVLWLGGFDQPTGLMAGMIALISTILHIIVLRDMQFKEDRF